MKLLWWMAALIMAIAIATVAVAAQEDNQQWSPAVSSDVLSAAVDSIAAFAEVDSEAEAENEMEAENENESEAEVESESESEIDTESDADAETDAEDVDASLLEVSSFDHEDFDDSTLIQSSESLEAEANEMIQYDSAATQQTEFDASNEVQAESEAELESEYASMLEKPKAKGRAIQAPRQKKPSMKQKPAPGAPKGLPQGLPFVQPGQQPPPGISPAGLPPGTPLVPTMVPMMVPAVPTMQPVQMPLPPLPSKKSNKKGKDGKKKDKKAGKKSNKKGGDKNGPKKPKSNKPRVEKIGKAPSSDARGIVPTGRGRSGKGCNGSACRGREHGWGIAPEARRRVQQRLPSPRLTGAASTLTRANVRCVLCQFITQKLKNQLTGEDPSSASLIEAFSFASSQAQSKAESTVAADAYADAQSSAIPSLFDHGADAPRRFRHTDVLAHRASRARFTQIRAGAPSEETTAQRAAYLKLYSTVYASFESLCAKKMPLAYLPYCNDMLKSYRFFAQGINYGDRAEQICMNGNFCDQRAYVRRVTHNAYQREPGDA